MPLSLSFLTGRDTLVQIAPEGDRYRVTEERAALYTQIAMRSGVIQSSLFAATDAGGGTQSGNVYENLTSLLTWRAAGLAVYGGEGNTFRDIHIADTLVYSGITISSLDFGIPMDGFGTAPTVFENISVVRSGGHFWGAQTFPGIWIFSADKVFQGIRVSNVDIVDPTYAGIMFQTKYTGGQAEFPVADTVFTDVTITGALPHSLRGTAAASR